MARLDEVVGLQNNHTQLLSRLEAGTNNVAISLENLDSGVKAIEATVAQGYQAMQQKVENASHKISNLSCNLSEDQYGQLVSKIDSLTMITQNFQDQHKKKAVSLSDRDIQTLAADYEALNASVSAVAGIQDAIDRHISYANDIEQNLYNEEAESLLNGLEDIFQLLTTQSTTMQVSRDVDSGSNLRDFNLLRRKVASSSRTTVNGKVICKMTFHVSCANIHHQLLIDKGSR